MVPRASAQCFRSRSPGHLLCRSKGPPPILHQFMQSVASRSTGPLVMQPDLGQAVFSANKHRQRVGRRLGTPIGVTNRHHRQATRPLRSETVPLAHPYPGWAPRGSGSPWARTSIAGSECDAATEMGSRQCHTGRPPAPGRSEGWGIAQGSCRVGQVAAPVDSPWLAIAWSAAPNRSFLQGGQGWRRHHRAVGIGPDGNTTPATCTASSPLSTAKQWARLGQSYLPRTGSCPVIELEMQGPCGGQLPRGQLWQSRAGGGLLDRGHQLASAGQLLSSFAVR